MVAFGLEPRTRPLAWRAVVCANCRHPVHSAAGKWSVWHSSYALLIDVRRVDIEAYGAGPHRCPHPAAAPRKLSRPAADEQDSRSAAAVPPPRAGVGTGEDGARQSWQDIHPSRELKTLCVLLAYGVHVGLRTSHRQPRTPRMRHAMRKGTEGDSAIRIRCQTPGRFQSAHSQPDQ